MLLTHTANKFNLPQSLIRAKSCHPLIVVHLFAESHNRVKVMCEFDRQVDKVRTSSNSDHENSRLKPWLSKNFKI